VSPHGKKRKRKRKKKKIKNKKRKANETEKKLQKEKRKSSFVSRHNIRVVSKYKKNNTHIDRAF
jgi:hypothetical protein